MLIFHTRLSPALHAWMRRLEPFGWMFSLLCVLFFGMLATPLPMSVRCLLLLGIGSGPLFHLVQRTASTTLLILLILLIEALLSLVRPGLNPAFHTALFQLLFGLMLWSLGYAFVRQTNRKRRRCMLAGFLWALSGVMGVSAVLLLVHGFALPSGGLSSTFFARLPLIDLLIGLGAIGISFGLPPVHAGTEQGRIHDR